MKASILKSIFLLFALFFIIQSFVTASGINLAAHPVLGISLAVFAVIAALALPLSKLMRK
jgi:hypothetical protein